jgi:hypothetical protein
MNRNDRKRAQTRAQVRLACILALAMRLTIFLSIQTRRIHVRGTVTTGIARPCE